MNLNQFLHNSNNSNFQHQSDLAKDKQGEDFLPRTNQTTLQENQQKQKIEQVKENNINDDCLSNKKENSIAQLKQLLNNKIVSNRELKKKISTSKNQINNIETQVDKMMNKNILKHSKFSQNVDIHSIFHINQNNHPIIKQLSKELINLRSQSIKTRNQIKIQQNSFLSPQKVINSEKTNEIKQKIDCTLKQLKELKQEKQYLVSQLKMLQQSQLQYEFMNKDDIQIKKNTKIQIVNQIKQQKQILYELQKQDRIITQKIKFIQQLQACQQKKRKVRLTAPQKLTIQENVKSITDEIKQMIDKRNCIQNQRKSILKNLQKQVLDMQNRNETIIRDVRKIDSQIINHFKTKLKKKKLRKNIQTEQNQSLIHDNRKQQIKTTRKLSKQPSPTITFLGETKKLDQNRPKQFTVDFITSPLTLLVQKHKTYQFFMNFSMTTTNEVSVQQKILNDEIFGSQLLLQKISFLVDDNTIFGVWASYLNEHGNQVRGWKIMPRIKPKKTATKEFIFNTEKKQIIKYVKVGVNENSNITYFYFITSELQKFQWGDLVNCIKYEEKSIIQYQGISIKGKLIQILDKETPNYYCLGGIGFNTMQLSSK